MEILITGGTGFIGRQLCKTLLGNGHQLTVLSRKPDTVASICGAGVNAISKLEDLNVDDQFDAIINLAGEGIADARWTTSRKQILLDSRINVTRQLIAFISRANNKPDVLISGSAVGYYGNQGSKELDENAMPGEDFASQLCVEWEASADQARAYGVRVCIIRTGLVIGVDGGFLKRMLLPFKLGLGGRLGQGTQWLSWVHMQDYIRILLQMLATAELQGAFNASAPNPVSNDQFTRCLAKLLHRPTFLPVPEFVLKLLMGEMSELVLGGQRVKPKRLLEEDFVFEYPELELALRDVV